MNRRQIVSDVARARAEYDRILRKYRREVRREQRRRPIDPLSRLATIISKIGKRIDFVERKYSRN